MERVDEQSNWVLELFTRVGVDVEVLVQRLPDEFGRMSRLDIADVPLGVGYSILNTAAELTNDGNLGLHMAQQMSLKDIGLYGYLLRNAKTVGELLELGAHYFNILFHTSRISFHHGETFSRFEYCIHSPEINSQRQDIDWSLGTYIHLIRSFIGTSWYPESVSLAYDSPDNPTECAEFYGDCVFYGQKSNYFEIGNEYLSIKVNNNDPALLKIIKTQADQLLNSWKTHDNLYDAVRLEIMRGLAQPGFNAEVLARQMGMSLSTLKRRLAAQQLSFRGIRDELIASMATQALKETTLPIGHIAAQVGYSEPAAFDRAFKRLTGFTPREYRKRTA